MFSKTVIRKNLLSYGSWWHKQQQKYFLGVPEMKSKKYMNSQDGSFLRPLSTASWRLPYLHPHMVSLVLICALSLSSLRDTGYTGSTVETYYIEISFLKMLCPNIAASSTEG